MNYNSQDNLHGSLEAYVNALHGLTSCFLRCSKVPVEDEVPEQMVRDSVLCTLSLSPEQSDELCISLFL